MRMESRTRLRTKCHLGIPQRYDRTLFPFRPQRDLTPSSRGTFAAANNKPSSETKARRTENGERKTPQLTTARCRSPPRKETKEAAVADADAGKSEPLAPASERDMGNADHLGAGNNNDNKTRSSKCLLRVWARLLRRQETGTSMR
jgi:hypothetical protein